MPICFEAGVRNKFPITIASFRCVSMVEVRDDLPVL